MKKLIVIAFVALFGAGCVTPIDKYYHPTPTTATFDWKCAVDAQASPNGKPFTMYVDDKGLHDMYDILHNPDVNCVWITAAQSCAGSPVYAECMSARKP